jgi:hypothetical protein
VKFPAGSEYIELDKSKPRLLLEVSNESDSHRNKFIIFPLTEREFILIPERILSIFHPEIVDVLFRFSEKVISILSSFQLSLVSNISISRTLGVASSFELNVEVFCNFLPAKSETLVHVYCKVGVSPVSQVSLKSNNTSSSSLEPPVDIPVGVIDPPSIEKSQNTIEESSIFSEKVILNALIFQLEILFSIVDIVSIVGFVESILNALEF